jgi:hypothetical protein
MVLIVSVDLNTRKFDRWLSQAPRKQVPFAIAKSLTMTAQDAQKEIKRELLLRFTIRNRHVPRGIRIKAATKRRPIAEVGSIDAFMKLQETGGVKKPRRSRRLAIPTRQVRRTKTGRVRKAQRPRQLLNRKNVFEARSRKGAVIFQRTRTGLKALYILRPSAQIKPRFGLRSTATKVAERRGQRNFVRAMAVAMRTAR